MRLLSPSFRQISSGEAWTCKVGHFVHALADLEVRVVRQGRPDAKRIQLFVNDLLNTGSARCGTGSRPPNSTACG